MRNILGILFIILLALKITGVAHISWGFVFFPVYIGVIFFVVLLVIALLASASRK